jgi:predicted  nucleic acid-binding Zn-ribbon protein
VKADPFAQLRLLELQNADTALSQLAHRRRSLPELQTIAECERRTSELHHDLVGARTEVADLDAEQRRLEADVETVRQRAERDQTRMSSGGVPAKEVSGLQHEVASLARRQGVLEDEVLELMERRETAEALVAEFTAAAESIAHDLAEAVASRDTAFAEIDRAVAERSAERERLAAQLPADLVALYDKIRDVGGGVGAAELRQRRCEGCRLELAGSELALVRAAAPDEVLRCDNCRRILIRTDESGL